MWRTLIAKTARITIGTLLGLPIVLYLLQEKLLFFPQRLDADDLKRIRQTFPEAEEIALSADDGTRLHGWLMRSHDSAVTPLVIYFGGNAEEVSYLLEHHPQLRGWSLLLMNYRGFGASGGKPGEAALFSDALRVYDAMRVHPGIDVQRIAVMGRSLGSGVAVYLASQRPVRGVVLVTPFDSVTEIAEQRFSYIPVRLLLKHPFDSLARAPAVQYPALVLAAENDSVIPSHHARSLFNAWGGPKSWHLLTGTDHIDISDHPDYWELIADFLEAI